MMLFDRSAVLPLLLLGFPSVDGAAPGSWEPIGPYEADVRAFVIAPSSPSRLYLAAHRDGVYRSDDRGDHWTRRSEGLPLDEVILSLSVDPANADVVLAGLDKGAGIYRTEDGGRTWSPSLTGLQATQILSIAHLGDTGIVLAGVLGVSGANAFGIYRSVDGGRSWKLVSLQRYEADMDNPGPRPAALTYPWVFRFAVHPTNPRIILANGFEAILRSVDGGLSWATIHMSRGWGDIAFSPADPSLVFASRSSLFVSRDGGVTFTPVATPGHADFLALDPTTPSGLLFAYGYDDLSYECPFFTTYVYSSTNQGSTWTRVFISSHSNQRPTALAYDSGSPSVVYLGMSGQNGCVGEYGGSRRGFLRSDAGGAPGTWHDQVQRVGNSLSPTLEVDARGIMFSHQPWISDIPGLQGQNLASSTDAGRNWTVMPWHGHTITNAVAVLEANRAVPGLLWHVGFWFEIDIGGAFAYRSTDGGLTWTPPYDPPPGLPMWAAGGFRAVTTNYGSGNRVYIWEETFSSTTPLYRSDDGGNSFQQIGAVSGFRDAVVDPASDLRLVVASDVAPVVRVSDDGGVNWLPLDSGLPAAKAIRILMNPADGDRLAVAFDTAPPYESTDGGQSWTPIPMNLAGDTVIDADWNPHTSEVFLTTKASGVLFSGTGLRNDGLGTRALNHIRYSSADHSLLVATQNGGIRRLELPETDVPDDRPARTHAETMSGRLALRVVPNPTGDGSTTIRFEVPAGSSVSVDVFDVLGRRVRTLVEGSGVSRIAEWDGRDDGGRLVAAGVYVVRLQSGEESVTRRVTVVR